MLIATPETQLTLAALDASLQLAQCPLAVTTPRAHHAPHQHGTHDATVSAAPHCLTTSRRLVLLATAKYTMDVNPFFLPHAL